jgi:hypothetical protein
MAGVVDDIANLRHPEVRRAAKPRMTLAADATRSSSAIAVILLLSCLMLVGCGKKNAPSAPPDEPNTYPRSYPSG